MMVDQLELRRPKKKKKVRRPTTSLLSRNNHLIVVKTAKLSQENFIALNNPI